MQIQDGYTMDGTITQKGVHFGVLKESYFFFYMRTNVIIAQSETNYSTNVPEICLDEDIK